MGFFQPRITVGVINGQVGSKKKNMFNIFIEKEDGLVTINKNKYYFLGATEENYSEVSASKGLAGAAIGSLFSPLGALVGAAVGSRKKQRTHYILAFMDVNTEEKYIVEVRLPDITPSLKKLKVHPIAKEQILSEEKPKTSAADEIREFKKLLDEGIITEEEFNEKKKQFLS